ncbi:MAG: bifunctional 2-C-methyl-D-erythritol 4-phosphate cytidylyltransferase/2-C-methyl-D-erythritol 2,4-cyclodiphosphate synthase [Henriciella sp.]|nr:bifunctional 2-C-methyl-D-erythritol 4-phosphate cytidylyltransferase/2-C-methyl-D-erythritol 2,4-cyclodiphosphate synthase [Henriciella sp.]
MSNAAIIVAAGRGERAGAGVPKQLRQLGDRLVFQWSLKAFAAHDDIDQTVLVVPSGEAETYIPLCPPTTIIVEGGATRTESVKAGLSACDPIRTQAVLIHDAARPGLTRNMISALISALQDADAAAPALKVSDALKRQDHGRVADVDRSNLYRVQTPQAFGFEMISAALAKAEDLVDDLAAIEAMGGTVRLIDGDERLGKITYSDDLKTLERLLMPRNDPPRLGTGFDVHAFEPGDGVILCGVKIPYDKKLAGHSDADVAWHALTDAILGAAALGDIGDHFPPSDPQWRGVDSSVFLRHAVDIARTSGWVLSSCDITVICEAPKVKPHREAMRQATADVTGLALDAISVKATTTEGLGFTGRKEGIAAQASAVLSPVRLEE